MYKYKTEKTNETISIYKKALIKFTLAGTLKYIGIVDLLLAFYWSKISELMGKSSVYILAAVIIFQVVMLIVYATKFINEWLKYVINSECEIGFSEEGIKIINDSELIQFPWEAVNEVRVYDDFMIVIYKIKDMPSQVLLFNSFDAEKSEIIKEIQKYKQVRG